MRVDDNVAGYTYTYHYDKAGNITYKHTHYLMSPDNGIGSPIDTEFYDYSSSAWGDLLTQYNNVSITYDTIGNPLTYHNGFTFTWKQGRRLATAVSSSYNLSFTYNDEGIRTSKTVNGVVHTYYLAGSTILSEEWTANNVQHILIYLYDAEGTPIGMQYRNSSYSSGTFNTYWFEKNLQGDIVAVYNEGGYKLVSYVYDAWGNVATPTYYNNGDSTAAQYNPFRYRGYYYDTELGFYYLNSRYYDPEIGRFVNADEFVNANGDIIGFNMFAYCSNNPVMGYDPSGQGWLEDWWDDTVDEAEKIWNAVSTTVVDGWNATKKFATTVWQDLESVNFNPFNSDESDVLASKYVSFYKGSLVIRYSNTDITSFGAFGMIVLDRNVNDTTTVKHEWGHNVQEKVMGTPGYLLYVGLPSAIYCKWGDYKGYNNPARERMYYSKIWERTADWLGGVNRNNYDSFWTLDNFLCW